MRVLVVDDEAMARRRLKRLVSARPGAEVVGECQDGSEVATFVAQGEVDLILLDVQMAEMSGVEAMGVLPNDGPLVVFVTAHAEHAVFAFDAGAVDYVLKPVEPARLGRALDRAEARLLARKARPSSTGADVDRLLIPTRRGLIPLDPDDIRYALVDGASTIIHAREAVYVTDFRLSALERRLPEDRFVRTHRRVLVHLAHVVALEPVQAGVYVAELTDGASVPVSRQAAKHLRALWAV